MVPASAAGSTRSVDPERAGLVLRDQPVQAGDAKYRGGKLNGLRILLVAYRFPPQGGGGVQRPAKWVKAWSRQGATVGVLAGPVSPLHVVDHTLAAEVPDDTPVRRAADPGPWHLVQRLRRGLPDSAPGRAADRLLVAGGYAIHQLSVPDTYDAWIPLACLAGARLARSLDAQVVVATGPPFTAFVTGALLARRLRRPLVLDYRDPWTATYLPASPTPLQRWINPRLERWALGRAAGVVAAHRAVFRTLDASGARLPPRLWVPNGYDPEDFPEASPVDPSCFTLAYTGSFYTFRNPRVLLGVIADLLAAGELDRRTFRFSVAGASAHDVRLAGGGSLEDVLQVEGYLPHGESVRRLRRSTVNLVFEGDTGGRNLHSPGKLYEVLFAGRPVLLLCPEGVTTRLARRSGGCRIAHPEDGPAIAAAIRKLYADWSGRRLDAPEARSLPFYDRSRQAARVLRFLRRAVATSGPPAGPGAAP